MNPPTQFLPFADPDAVLEIRPAPTASILQQLADMADHSGLAGALHPIDGGIVNGWVPEVFNDPSGH